MSSPPPHPPPPPYNNTQETTPNNKPPSPRSFSFLNHPNNQKPKTKPPPSRLHRLLNHPHFPRLPTLLSIPFLVLLLVPWIVTSVYLDQKPISSTSNGTSYVEPTGRWTESELENVTRWSRAVPILNLVAALFTVPLISALLSQAAVVVASRRRGGSGRKFGSGGGGNLSIPGLLSLADAPWGRLDVRTKYGRKKSVGFVQFGFVLMVISMLQLLLQIAVVDYETIQVAASDYGVPDIGDPSVMYPRFNRFYTVGYDPEPKHLSLLYGHYVTRRAGNAMSLEGQNDLHSTFWTLNSTLDSTLAMNGTMYNYVEDYDVTAPNFISSVPVGTNTGVLRYHALRLNSSLSCDVADEFPASCEGDQPFEADYPVYVGEKEVFSVRWCVPGNFTEHPWSLSRSRQDIQEEMWLSATVAADFDEWRDPSYQDSFKGNFTTRCTLSTTRGYFELPNYYNGNTPGPLLETWPEKEELERNFNDAIEVNSLGDAGIPSDIDDYAWQYEDTPLNGHPFSPVQPDPFGTASYIPSGRPDRVPGPLTLTSLSMLGNGSWFDTLLRSNMTSPSPDHSLTSLALTSICGGSSSPPFLSTGEGSTFSVQARRFYFLPGDWCDNLFDRTDSDAPTAQGHLSYIEEPALRLASMANQWFHGFWIPQDEDGRLDAKGEVEASLLRATAVATEAMLKEGAVSAGDGSSATWPMRRVFMNEGKTVMKPVVGVAGKVVVWIFLGLEILGIVILVGFAVIGGTFTGRLDAALVAGVGGQLVGSQGASVPSLGQERDEWVDGLEEKEGRIGRVIGSGDDGLRAEGGDRESHEMSSLTPIDEAEPTFGFDRLRYGMLAVGGKGKLT